MSSDERWLAVGGYEGVYEVSSYGRVRRIKACRGATVGRVLVPRDNGHGYVTVSLNVGRQQKSHAVNISNGVWWKSLAEESA